jgi:hypothetical protein
MHGKVGSTGLDKRTLYAQVAPTGDPPWLKRGGEWRASKGMHAWATPLNACAHANFGTKTRAWVAPPPGTTRV